jgi:uncharacterized protein (TIGR01777 family)
VKVVLAGASGLIGGALHDRLLRSGHEVSTLVRRPPASAADKQWHPERRELDPAWLVGADAVICLSGAGVGDHRWTEDYKRTIASSRTDPVATIASSMAGLDQPPPTLICASAVGYYGDTGDHVVTETAAPGAGFLADVCRDWEAAADPAREAGIRVVHLRTGLVLGDGGLLARLKRLFKLGVGGRLGTGRQYMPWISITDEIAAIEFCLSTTAIAGPVNLCGPTPVTNAEFTATLARLLHRPALVRAPAFGLRIVLGEFADDVLGGQRAVPAVLTANGFEFTHPDLESALRSVL